MKSQWPSDSGRREEALTILLAGRARAMLKAPRLGCYTECGAFSLIELLVVVVLILVLTTLYWGSTTNNRGKQSLAACQQNLEKTYIALQIFANDHESKFPSAPAARTSEEALDALVPRYSADTSLFICPGSKDSPPPGGESIAARKISYAYYMGRRESDNQQPLMSDRQVDTLFKTAGQLVFSSTGKPPGNNHEKLGGNFLFCDGHAEASPARLPFSMTSTQGVVLLNPRP